MRRHSLDVASLKIISGRGWLTEFPCRQEYAERMSSRYPPKRVCIEEFNRGTSEARIRQTRNGVYKFYSVACHWSEIETEAPRLKQAEKNKGKRKNSFRDLFAVAWLKFNSLVECLNLRARKNHRRLGIEIIIVCTAIIRE